MRLGTKGKKALGYAKKGLVVAGAIGSIVGLGVKGGVGEKVVDTKNKVEAAPVIAQGIVDAGKQGAAQAKANPLKAPQAFRDAKVKAGGIAAAAKIDPVGAADTLKFQQNPTAPPPPRAPVDKRYGTADAGGTGSRIETQDTSRAGDIQSMIKTCEFKYKKKNNQGMERRRCKQRVKAGGRP